MMSAYFQPGGIILLGILGGGVLPSFPNPDPISDQILSFPHPCSDLARKIYIPFQTCNSSQNSTVHVYMEEIMSSLFRLQRQQNDILKSILNSNFTLSFLFI